MGIWQVCPGFTKEEGHKSHSADHKETAFGYSVSAQGQDQGLGRRERGVWQDTDALEQALGNQRRGS